MNYDQTPFKKYSDHGFNHFGDTSEYDKKYFKIDLYIIINALIFIFG